MTSEVVSAGRFQLVDKHGNTRAVLACDADTGAPSCTFLDSCGRTRITVGIAWNDMPSIQLNAEDGKAHVALIVRPENDGMVVVVDSKGDKQVITAS
jgi:hypothetical protein